MENQKKWFKTWWGILIIIFFFPIAISIIVIQKENWGKKIKIPILGFIWIVMFSVMLSDTADEKNTTQVKEKRIEKSNSTDKKEELTKVIKEKKVAVGKNKKIEQEKQKIKNKLNYYEQQHLSEWNDMVKALSSDNPDLYDIYNKSDIALDKVEAIWLDTTKLKWGGTGDEEFDNRAKDLKEDVNLAYYYKRTAVKDLLKWLDDVKSPKKQNKAMKAMKDAANYWQGFILRATVLTITEDDLN